jgi:hypothetical protein
MRHTDDFVPVTGGFDLPASRIRDDLDSLRNATVVSDLDRRIVQLLALHPQLQIRFRNQDLQALDNPTKTALLKDMSDVLGIRPLRKS